MPSALVLDLHSCACSNSSTRRGIASGSEPGRLCTVPMPPLHAAQTSVPRKGGDTARVYCDKDTAGGMPQKFKPDPPQSATDRGGSLLKLFPGITHRAGHNTLFSTAVMDGVCTTGRAIIFRACPARVPRILVCRICKHGMLGHSPGRVRTAGTRSHSSP